MLPSSRHAAYSSLATPVGLAPNIKRDLILAIVHCSRHRVKSSRERLGSRCANSGVIELMGRIVGHNVSGKLISHGVMQ